MPAGLFRWTAAFGFGLVVSLMAGCGWGGDPRNFGLLVSPSTVTVVADYTSPPITVQVHPEFGFTDDVQLSASGDLECLPCTRTTTGTTTFRFNTYTNTTPGDYSIVLHGTGGKYPHDVTAFVKVLPYDGTIPPPDFDFDVDPTYSLFSTSSKGVKGTVFYTFTFYRYNHYTGPITVSGAVFSELTCGGSCLTITSDNTATLAVSVTGADPGVYTNVFTASAPGVSKTASARIVITPSAIPSPPAGR